MRTSRYENGRSPVGAIIVLVVIVLIGGLAWAYASSRGASMWETFRLVKDTSQEAATTTKVTTALSKRVSAFDTQVELGQAPELKDQRITVQVSKQRVSLDGAVDWPAQRRAADRIALLVPGVQGFTSNLVVAMVAAAPGSPDGRLARRVESERYGRKAVPLKDVQIGSQDARESRRW
jgi:BON domain-containing protein